MQVLLLVVLAPLFLAPAGIVTSSPVFDATVQQPNQSKPALRRAPGEKSQTEEGDPSEQAGVRETSDQGQLEPIRPPKPEAGREAAPGRLNLDLVVPLVRQESTVPQPKKARTSEDKHPMWELVTKVIEILPALAWPLLLFMLLRTEHAKTLAGHLVDLVPRVEKAKIGETEVSFGGALRAASQSAEDVANTDRGRAEEEHAPPPDGDQRDGSAPVPLSSFGSDWKSFLQYVSVRAEISPVEAILSCWLYVEEMMRRRARVRDLYVVGHKLIRAYERTLRPEARDRLVPLLRDLSAARNAAAHELDAPTAFQAMEYVALVRTGLEAMEALKPPRRDSQGG